MITHQKPPRLRHDITRVVVIKIAIILLAGFTIFGAHARLHVDAALMGNHLLSEN